MELFSSLDLESPQLAKHPHFYLRPSPANTITISLEGKIVLPGLINTHSHLAQFLLRGLAEDLPLHSCLCDAIWPLEANFDAEDGYVAALLTIAEMLKEQNDVFPRK